MRGLGVVFNLFLASSRLQKKRAILTIASIAWGSVALLLLLAFGQGLKNQLSTANRGMGTNIAVLWHKDIPPVKSSEIKKMLAPILDFEKRTLPLRSRAGWGRRRCLGSFQCFRSFAHSASNASSSTASFQLSFWHRRRLLNHRRGS